MTLFNSLTNAVISNLRMTVMRIDKLTLMFFDSWLVPLLSRRPSSTSDNLRVKQSSVKIPFFSKLTGIKTTSLFNQDCIDSTLNSARHVPFTGCQANQKTEHGLRIRFLNWPFFYTTFATLKNQTRRDWWPRVFPYCDIPHLLVPGTTNWRSCQPNVKSKKVICNNWINCYQSRGSDLPARQIFASLVSLSREARAESMTMSLAIGIISK